MQNAKDYVNQGMSSVQITVNSLQQSLASVEKESNKAKIQSAISSLNSACQELSQYKD